MYIFTADSMAAEAMIKKVTQPFISHHKSRILQPHPNNIVWVVHARRKACMNNQRAGII